MPPRYAIAPAFRAKAGQARREDNVTLLIE
jgi:hypothetical protein